MYELYDFYLSYQDTIWVALLGIIVLGVTYGIKIPYKMFTSKVVPEKYRKIANKFLIALVFGFGILAQYVYSLICKTSLNIAEGLGVGSAALSLYAILEGKKKKDMDLMGDIKAVEAVAKDMVAEVMKDGKVTKEDVEVFVSASQRLYDELNKK